MPKPGSLSKLNKICILLQILALLDSNNLILQNTKPYEKPHYILQQSADPFGWNETFRQSTMVDWSKRDLNIRYICHAKGIIDYAEL